MTRALCGGETGLGLDAATEQVARVYVELDPRPAFGFEKQPDPKPADRRIIC